MTDVTVTETNVIPSQNYVSSFFSKLPTDSRFIRVNYQQISPFTAIDKTSNKIEFIFDTLKSPMCYLLSDMLMSVTVVITQTDRTTLPIQTARVGPANCAVSSLFDTCVMKINDISVTEAGDFYAYRTYLSQLMTYPDAAKSSQMIAAGYLADIVTENAARNIEPSGAQNGFLERSNWFRKNRKEGNAYKPEGVTFLAPFKHELAGCLKPLPPGTKVSFDLTRSSDAFYLMRGPKTDDSADATDYRANILKCFLYVKIAQMVEPVYKSLISKFEKEPLFYHYRKVICKAYAIPAEGQIFSSQNLFPENAAPVKVHFVIIETDAFRGNIAKNPYGFYRKWVTISAPAPHEAEIYNQYWDQEVQNQVRDLEEQLKEQRREATEQQEALSNQLQEMRKEQKKEQRKQHKRQKASEKIQKELLKAIQQQNAPIPVAPSTSFAQSALHLLSGGPPVVPNSENTLPEVDLEANQNSKGKKPKGYSKRQLRKKQKVENFEKDSEERIDPSYNPSSSSDSSTESESGDDSKDERENESEGSKYHSSKSDLVANQNKLRTKTQHQPNPSTSTLNEESIFENAPLPPNRRFKNVETAGDIVYVQELSLKINGDPLDQLTMRSTEDESIFDYVRLQNTNGFINHVQSNGISYEDFLHGTYICAFDLSTTNEGANSQYSVPSVRQGNLSVQINFSIPPTVNLTLLMFGECTAVLSLPHDGKITKTYIPFKQD